MENFDQNIKEKLDSYPTSEIPSEAEMLKFMRLLDEALPQDSKVIPIAPLASTKFKSNSWLKIAAIFILFLLASIAAYQMGQVSIESGEQLALAVELPDHSTITMKENSKVEYNRVRWFFDRSLNFSGEGYFEVEKGKTFTVHSSLGSTQVLGTSFTINSGDQTYEVACFTGKVSVVSNTSPDEIILMPGDGVILKSANFTPYQMQSLEKPNWIAGEFYFEEENFSQVIEILEKQYQVKVSYPAEYETMKYTGYFDNKNLEKALRLVCEPFELTYEINGKTIQFKP